MVVPGVVLPLASSAATVLPGHPGVAISDPGLCPLLLASCPVAGHTDVDRLDVGLDRCASVLYSTRKRVPTTLRLVRKQFGDQVANRAPPGRPELEGGVEQPVEV